MGVLIISTSLPIGTAISLILLVVCLLWMSAKMRRKKLLERREKFFQLNGGHLLKELLSSNNLNHARIFTIRELAAATSNFSEDHIVGKGGYGTVYKGILQEDQVVAVKKSKLVDKSQIEQFINELVILAQIDHPNVVKLLGCCLEDEVPMLVYEFIPNGTLYDHIHAQGGTSWLTWSKCLRIATEAAKALAYVHSIPIIHRDIKSTNILLDENNVAKISDFGISRLIPLGRTRFSTIVQGTLGYLDPKYLSSSQLTNKSDVFGFGVVLAELLTKEAPVLADERDSEERNLSVYFLNSIEGGSLNCIIDPAIVKEAPQDQLIILAELIQSCLSEKGNERPTMRQVEMVLQELCNSQESRL